MCDKVILLIRSYYLFVHVENQRKKATRAHAKSMMALTTGTLAPLHRSPSQQLISHLTLAEGSDDLHKSDFSPASHWALVVQPLAYTAADIPPLDPSTLYLPQRLATEGQSVSFLMSAQSSQPFVETHW